MDPPIGGSPDCGNGYFSDRLSYKKWYIFNKAQRVQANFFESITVIVFLAFVGVLMFPYVATIAYMVIFLGRAQFNHLGNAALGTKCRWYMIMIAVVFL